MSKIKLYTLLWALMITSVLAPQAIFAGKPDVVKTGDMTVLNRTIRKTIAPPRFTLNDQEEGNAVIVIFELTPAGKIDILKVTAPTKRLDKYVREELSGLTAENLVNPEDLRYQVNIRFYND